MREIIVGASGASGMPLLIKCLQLIQQAEGYQSGLIMTDSAKITYAQEMSTGNRASAPVQNTFASIHPTDALTDGPCPAELLADHVYPADAIWEKPASGSYRTAGMLIVPCSMKTIAGICSGYTDNLLLRAADVTLKEQRPLVLAARETPLNQIHLRNLYELSKMQGVHIIPPMMTFYNRPDTIDDMIYHLAAKLVEPFGIEAPAYCRWDGTLRDVAE